MMQFVSRLLTKLHCAVKTSTSLFLHHRLDTLYVLIIRGKEGVPTLFPSCCFNQLIQLKGEFGAKDQLRGDSFPVSEISLPYAEHDIDTKKELFELRRLK
ncbi:hypothetical protein L5159_004346 [Vibrio parahaemolyticus]|nr:hypothetical protein [Vibrio parahaemolyticus]